MRYCLLAITLLLATGCDTEDIRDTVRSCAVGDFNQGHSDCDDAILVATRLAQGDIPTDSEVTRIYTAVQTARAARSALSGIEVQQLSQFAITIDPPNASWSAGELVLQDQDLQSALDDAGVRSAWPAKNGFPGYELAIDPAAGEFAPARVMALETLNDAGLEIGSWPMGNIETDITYSDTARGATVTFYLRWGDCPSGCINEKTWIVELVDGIVSTVTEADPT